MLGDCEGVGCYHAVVLHSVFARWSDLCSRRFRNVSGSSCGKSDQRLRNMHVAIHTLRPPLSCDGRTPHVVPEPQREDADTSCDAVHALC